ncbi:MAG: hypothetical protein JWO25_2232 [Alphaproteobacteria bacterium]|nr:hypothetical protein [Alphaproteobacteria bacterium]
MAILILASALLALQSPPAVGPSVESSDEIVVIGQRVRRVRLTTRRDRRTGAQTCAIKRSSGDPAIDGAMCEAALSCAKIATREAQMVACLGPLVAAIPRRLAEMRALPK